MKNMKNIFVAIVSAISFLSIQSAKASQGPGFEFYNKDTDYFNISTITIALVFNKDPKTAIITDIAPNKKFSKTINLNDEILLCVFKKQTPITSVSSIKDIYQKRPDYIYIINAPGKTKYVSFNTAKAPHWVYPQTGTLMGLTGKSDSGYSLQNNIKQSDLRMP